MQYCVLQINLFLKGAVYRLSGYSATESLVQYEVSLEA